MPRRPLFSSVNIRPSSMNGHSSRAHIYVRRSEIRTQESEVKNEKPNPVRNKEIKISHNVTKRSKAVACARERPPLYPRFISVESHGDFLRGLSIRVEVAVETFTAFFFNEKLVSEDAAAIKPAAIRGISFSSPFSSPSNPVSSQRPQPESDQPSRLRSVTFLAFYDFPAGLHFALSLFLHPPSHRETPSWPTPFARRRAAAQGPAKDSIFSNNPENAIESS